MESSPNYRDTISMGEVSTSGDADDILFSMQNSVWGGESHLLHNPWNFL